MDNKINTDITVSYIVYEGGMARMERINRRVFIVMFVINLILTIALIVSNALWIHHDSQYEDVSITQEVQQDTESGDNSFVGGDFNGETESKNDNKSSGKEKRQD